MLITNIVIKIFNFKAIKRNLQKQRSPTYCNNIGIKNVDTSTYCFTDIDNSVLFIMRSNFYVLITFDRFKIGDFNVDFRDLLLKNLK